jgi:uncharacterized protein YndB with AHSA1/START domain
MRVTAESEHPMTEESVRAATGRGWEEWYALLDGAGGTAPGRRAITDTLMKEHALPPWWAQTIAVEYEGARGLREKDGRPRGYAICVTKTIAAPAEAVFDAFGSPAALGAWLADGAGADASFAEGGRFATGDGNRGSYTKLARPKTLRLIWDPDDPSLASTVELKLTEKEGKCGLVLNHERIQTRPLADGLRAAWGGAIDRLKRRLER